MVDQMAQSPRLIRAEEFAEPVEQESSWRLPNFQRRWLLVLKERDLEHGKSLVNRAAQESQVVDLLLVPMTPNAVDTMAFPKLDDYPHVVTSLHPDWLRAIRKRLPLSQVVQTSSEGDDDFDVERVWKALRESPRCC